MTSPPCRRCSSHSTTSPTGNGHTPSRRSCPAPSAAPLPRVHQRSRAARELPMPPSSPAQCSSSRCSSKRTCASSSASHPPTSSCGRRPVATSCATGKFFNLRRFTKSRFEEPAGGGGQLPYWVEESLFAYLRETDVLRVRDEGLIADASRRKPSSRSDPPSHRPRRAVASLSAGATTCGGSPILKTGSLVARSILVLSSSRQRTTGSYCRTALCSSKSPAITTLGYGLGARRSRISGKRRLDRADIIVSRDRTAPDRTLH